MTQTPGIVDSGTTTRRVQLTTAIAVCAAELQDQRPSGLPDKNCFLDEFDAYVVKYHLDDLKPWRAERAYATLACTPIGADKQTN